MAQQETKIGIAVQRVYGLGLDFADGAREGIQRILAGDPNYSSDGIFLHAACLGLMHMGVEKEEAKEFLERVLPHIK